MTADKMASALLAYMAADKGREIAPLGCHVVASSDFLYLGHHLSF